MSTPNLNPETAHTTPDMAPQVEARAIDLKLRRQELKQELESLGKKGREYGTELWSDSRQLLGSTWDYAKAVANDVAQKVTPKKAS